MPQLDYTNMRVNNKLHFVKCPICGNTGRLRKYDDGSAMVIHTAHIELGFNHIDKFCYLKNEHKT